VVGRIHGTLKSIVARCIEKKGNWAEIVPMALYFMLCTPTFITLMSLGDIVLEQWVMENSERVQNLRDNAVVSYKQCLKMRKEQWDMKAKLREFKPGDKVLMRNSGMNYKL